MAVGGCGACRAVRTQARVTTLAMIGTTALLTRGTARMMPRTRRATLRASDLVHISNEVSIPELRARQAGLVMF